jgi:TM2 domain-containing membrane protein YozV
MNELQEYTLRWRGREVGPFPLSEINRQLDEHEIGMGHEIFYQDKWITVEEFMAALSNHAAPAPTPPEKPSPVQVSAPLVRDPPIPTTRADGGRRLRPRRRLLFGLLGVLVGFVGAHNFYARHWLTGLLQLLLSVATCLMGFGIIASWIWAMVEVVIVHKDGEGVEMI